MTSQPTPKRWRPRFSLRTLVILVTLVCCYFGLWEVTQTHGVPAVETLSVETHMSHRGGEEYTRGGNWRTLHLAWALQPFVVRVLGGRIRVDEDGYGDNSQIVGPRIDYYFWFFGYVAKLPYERDIATPVQIEFIEGLDVMRL